LLDEIGGNGKPDAAKRPEALIAAVTPKWGRGFGTLIAEPSGQPFRRECGENGSGARLRLSIPNDNRRLLAFTP